VGSLRSLRSLRINTTASDRTTLLHQATDESNQVTSYAPPSIAALGGAAGALSTRGGDVVRRRRAPPQRRRRGERLPSVVFGGAQLF